jgi:SAM-dependent methyltransferase
MITARLLEAARCPDCGGTLRPDGERFRCEGCGRAFSGHAGFLDLRPAAAFAEQTKYLDEALHADARHEAVAPPLLGSKIRNDMLRAFLQPGPGDRILDLGCGSGRAIVWNADSGAALTGVDISAHFAAEAVDGHELVLGDLRRLPLGDGVFTKAWSLDVMEHLSRQALRDVLAEANRVLAPDGRLFIFSHVRKNGWIAGGTRLVNRLARALEGIGLLDLRQERLRKSDHLNPIADHEDLARVMREAGFAIERVTYYTPIVGAFVENVMVRMAERYLVRRAAARRGDAASPDDAAAVRHARASAQARLRRRGPAYRALWLLSRVMMLDVLLFGRLRSGPFFLLARKMGPPPGA